MAALAGDLSKQLLGQSDASKAFRPWWDTIEDGVMYSLVVMGNFQCDYCQRREFNCLITFTGVITLPMTFLSGTPLDCTIHPNLWFNNYTSELFDQKDLPKFARYLRHYSKKYCTEMHVSPFLLYLRPKGISVPVKSKKDQIDLVH